mmetsp:Transcript_22162/g.68963  ORF Transcript_22162/g.68963 Transcript_22162/m.68963 type:complete len:236 (-) Transcript_22162:1184-1891(-)
MLERIHLVGTRLGGGTALLALAVESGEARLRFEERHLRPLKVLVHLRVLLPQHLALALHHIHVRLENLELRGHPRELVLELIDARLQRLLRGTGLGGELLDASLGVFDGLLEGAVLALHARPHLRGLPHRGLVLLLGCLEPLAKHGVVIVQALLGNRCLLDRRLVLFLTRLEPLSQHGELRLLTLPLPHRRLVLLARRAEPLAEHLVFARELVFHLLPRLLLLLHTEARRLHPLL